MAHKQLGKLLAITLLALFVAAVPAAQALAQEEQNAKVFELTEGWYEGRQTFYYDFGANTRATEDGTQVIAAPIYVLITGMDEAGNPIMVEGQHNIVDVKPGDAGYSDLWEVTFVTVPADYQADTFKSADEVRSSGYEMARPGVFVNCPIVPEGSTLSEGGAPLVQGWYKGEAIYYFDFGPNSTATASIYAFVTGFDSAGNPQFVEGQNNVVDVIPGDPGYSAFWFVNLVQVPAGYEANSIRSVADVMASGFEIVQSGLLVNCPIIRTDEQPPSMLPVTGGSSTMPLLLIGAGLAAAALGLAGLGLWRLARVRAR